MFELIQGNLLDADVEAVVNTVNTEGVMGKGIALQFRKAYPDNYAAYRKACKAGEVQPGRMFIFDRHTLTLPRYIINFPTKRHWRSKSRIADIESGLDALVRDVRRLDIHSVAVPPLGCGNGGLRWIDVLERMRAAFKLAPKVRWLVFEPKGAPKPEKMKNRTMRPRMTQGRAAVIGLINRYLVPGFDYPVSLLEIQKLVYFLTEAGEQLNQVHFVKHHYGPYADVLRHVLEKMEGHFITGYGAGENKPETPIHLLSGAAKEAEAFLEEHSKTRARFDRVAQLIEGFETPLGMELLATVHWVAVREHAAPNPGAVLSAIQAWSTRKAKLMSAEQVSAAWARLDEFGWLQGTN
ncbi:MAG: Appr-1-p processing protein [Acidobacteria bacterium]|nr:MAG: Appr-1-p processing protein [Acidobacteriota bacterium]